MALISIAHPNFREELEKAARDRVLLAGKELDAEYAECAEII
jgi:acyl-CoA hydrolase